MIEEEYEWTPTEDDILWTQAHIEGLRIGGMWSPDGSGLDYERTGEEELTLRRMHSHPAAMEVHGRIKRIFDELDWELLDEEIEVYLPPLNPAEAAMQDRLHQQDTASRWTCVTEECETLLGDMELEKGEWLNFGLQEMMLPDGTTEEVERWGVNIECHDCGTTIQMDPYDYGLLAGDDLFYRYKCGCATMYRMLTREDVLRIVDAGGSGVALGTRCPNCDGVMPPHLRGTFCSRLDNWGEEE